MCAILAPVGAGSLAHAQLSIPRGGDLLNRPVLERVPTERVRETAEKTTDQTADTAVDSAGELLESAEGAAGGAVQTVIAAAGSLLLGNAPDGSLIELESIVALVDDETLEALSAGGYAMVSSRPLDSLGLTLVTIRKPAGAALPATLAELQSRHPSAAIDYNHIFGYASSGTSATGAAAPDEAAAEAGRAGLSVGVIDSAVMSEHHALRDVEVIQRDFVSADAERPTTHGTAVASLLVRSAGNGITIRAASIFFQAENYAPGATTESLLAALDWLVAEQVDVINMSLAGPGNNLLQAAIAAIGEDGPVLVAAAGNNGPASGPLYPAAYEGIIGVTAVDRRGRVFRYANRGDYVDFAARGVDVKVADSSTGGYRIESGTSMASPHIAAVVARMLRDGVSRPALMSWLMSSAEDLGRKGHDPVFGHGLISDPPLIVSGD